MLNFEGAIAIDAQGHNGGIALLWRHKEEVKLLSYSRNHIDAIVNIKYWSKFRLIGIYGESDRAKRRETWNLIYSLKDNSVIL